MVEKILLVIYLLSFVSTSFIQTSAWESRNDSNYFTFSYLEDWMPEWTKMNNRYLFNALYYGQESNENGEVELNNMQLKQIQCRIVVLTAGDEDFNTLVELERNRIEYSKNQKYCYLHFFCKKSKKYLAIWKLFTSKKLVTYNRKIINLTSIDWVLYMDLDAMFTNYKIKVEQIIERYTLNSTSLIISADTKCYDEKYPINNGIMLFKNSLFSLQLAFQVLIKQAYRNSLLYNGTNQWNAKGLKDQPLLTNILVQDKKEIDAEKVLKYCTFVMEHNLDLNGIVYSSDHVTVVSPRVMNSVRRSSTHFRKDNLLWHWRSGDWIAHLSGLTPMASSLRKKFIKQVCDSSPDEVCPFNIIIDNNELVVAENKLSLIRYKKELKLLNQGILNKDIKPVKKDKKKSKLNKKSKMSDSKNSNLESNLNENNLKITKFDEINSKENEIDVFKDTNIHVSNGQNSQQDSNQNFVGSGFDSKDFTSNSNLEAEPNSELVSDEGLISNSEQDQDTETTLEAEIVSKSEPNLGKEQVVSESGYSSASNFDSVSISGITLEKISEEGPDNNPINKQDQPGNRFENQDLDINQPYDNKVISTTPEEQN
ncbi:uncharacterized protein cubi_02594 [Cryptosporidium ubiquitum]|uniref:Uncharacterized protein n=1 Tax=Cryptosporidium ubiquitum TaxID=857276 RepID=A0A1J4MGM0_9CRYT|nr:uncharacterized protein cubi_02594 [Cryptosporidium ubiquitum]OII73382.1 hypothetical protein cubi_02594 [Cryptosporidium ubiquitum]